MKILIHDYAGHPFQVQLSRALAQRGYTVIHAYCATVEGAKGNLQQQTDDPATLRIIPLRTSQEIQKYNFVKRWQQEREYGRVLAQLIRDERPTIVLSANTPLEAQAIAQRCAKQINSRFMFWVQDLNGFATYKILKQKLPIVGGLIGKYYMWLEKRLLQRSDAVVVISEDFLPALADYAGQHPNAHVIPNWAPLNELTPTTKRNTWSIAQGLADKTVFLYAGMLGFKHNPQLLLALARHFQSHPDVVIVVISQGIGADWLKTQGADLQNLKILPFQPFEQMSAVLSSADVLMAILEPDAAIYSVPSKILSYVCIGKPLLVAVPDNNLGAKIVNQSHCGKTVHPSDEQGFIRHAQALLENPTERQSMGDNARYYAQQHFAIDTISEQFLKIFNS
ncbi:glycosyltransferase family 4 protein [Beggiatoa leptomitoformis]|uniref:Glycosyltransferase n=1 Tax=Beggiatoa leptomitoformis TaxID=288004 RepID=A0A2N9Y9Z8_9GAMM|nr:glycosyltransferase family 4 protein [Beggiatoa leptomitoformis]ALG67294.1 glycosyltransferase [Beggiatoa leptomitoformis]AUI67274.1 glycosyltransferase [Beggiatoa leptomitoformis]